MANKKKQNQGPVLILILIIVGVLVIIGGIWLIGMSSSPEETSSSPEFTLDIFEEGGTAADNAFLQSLSIQSRLRNQYQPDREGYGTFTLGEGSATFDDVAVELPPLPEDMWKLRYVMATGASNIDLCQVTKAYYQQPEFITLPPFEQTGLRYWTNPDPTHWVESGEGGFPQMQRIVVETSASPDEPIIGSACAFVFTAWGVQTYRGVYLQPYFMDKGVKVNPDQTTQTVVATGSDGADHIQVQATPNVLLLEPTFPVIKRGWIKQVTLTFTIDPDTPAGIYLVGVKALPVPDQSIDEQLRAASLEQGGIYARPNTAFSVSIGDVADVPPLQFEIEVRN